MSDVERHRPQRSTEGTPAPVRNMADIAKLFLDGVRPVPNGAPTPRRNPPSLMPQPRIASTPAAVAPKPTPTPITVAEIHAIPPLMLALARPTRDAATWGLLTSAAAGLAIEHSTTVGLIGIQSDASGPVFVIDVFGAESPDDLPEIRPSTAPSDLQIARALYTLRPAIGTWLIAAPDTDNPAFANLAASIPDWLMVCPTDNEGLVAAYQQFKRAWILGRPATASCATPPSIFLLTDDQANAAKVHHRVRAAAREFLKTDLNLAGIGPLETQPPTHILSLPLTAPQDAIWASLLDELAPAQEATAETESPTPPTPPTAPAAAPPPPKTPLAQSNICPPRHNPTDIETALDNLASDANEIVENSAAAAQAMFDHLTQVLDPEERKALSAAFDEPSSAAAHAEEPAPTPASARKSAPTAPTVTVEPPPSNIDNPFPTLRAFDLLATEDRNRISQWQAVERSIRDLVPHSILLDARPPMSWATETCIAIDPDGRLHVWTLYKDGASWYALREWASEHRNLLALTRRDLVLSKEADVVVHIVLPLEDAPAQTTPSIVNTILRTAARNIHLYRLRTVQWNARQGMIVVPIA